MPLECAACEETKGINKFPGDQRKRARPVCKICVRANKDPKPLPDIQNADPGASGVDAYELMKVIGQGAFGRVFLVCHRTTRKIQAMKVISKKVLIERESVRYLLSERDVMTKIRHPFVIHLTASFQSDSKVYLVMDYQSGGELFSYLRSQGTFDEDTTRFYIAEMVLALEHLHTKGIIHRDLKPENVLLSADGHIKITDFGLAREYQEGEELLTVCGTKEYMAPEMILGKGYTQAVDWYSLGALAHEMLIGRPPFESKNNRDLHQKILTSKLQLPNWLSKDAHSLLKSLLERNVNKRLGAGKSSMFIVRGDLAVKRHPFFKGVDWKALEKELMDPPYLPKVAHEADTQNFDTEFTRMAASDVSCEAVEDEDENRLFHGFSFYGPEELPVFTRASSSSKQSPELRHRLSSLVLDNAPLDSWEEAIASDT